MHDGRAALDEARARRPDLIVLDVMMPGVDGLDVCRILRRDSDVPVLMLTAQCTDEDLLLGFDLGADDYLTKPYSPRELMARVRGHRCSGAKTRREPVAARRGVRGSTRSGTRSPSASGAVECTPGEFRLLAALAAQPDRVFTRGQLLEHARGLDAFITERTVDVHVMNLRKKIEANSAQTALPAHRLRRRLQDHERGLMRSSLLVRLLVSSALVAVCSIAATAWLAVQGTSGAIRQQQGQALASDQEIYDALLELAGTGRSGTPRPTRSSRS